MIQLAWLTIGFKIFIAFTLPYRLIIQSYKVCPYNLFSLQKFESNEWETSCSSYNYWPTFKKKTEKEALGFNEILIESLKRKIMVKLYCPWCNVLINLIVPNNTWALCEHWIPWKESIWCKLYSPWYNFLNKFLNARKNMSFWWKFV